MRLQVLVALLALGWSAGAWGQSGAGTGATPSSSTSTFITSFPPGQVADLLASLRREMNAAVADDDADAIATLEAAVQAIKRRHPARQPQ